MHKYKHWTSGAEVNSHHHFIYERKNFFIFYGLSITFCFALHQRDFTIWRKSIYMIKILMATRLFRLERFFAVSLLSLMTLPPPPSFHRFNKMRFDWNFYFIFCLYFLITRWWLNLQKPFGFKIKNSWHTGTIFISIKKLLWRILKNVSVCHGFL